MTFESITTDGPPSPHLPGLTLVATICWIAGIAGGHFCAAVEPWLAVGGTSAFLAVAMAFRRRPRGVRAWSLVALIALGGAWAILRSRYTSATDLRQFVADRAQLVQVTGVVASWPRMSKAADGEFGRFNYRSPGSTWVLETQTIQVNGCPAPATGWLNVHMQQPDLRMHEGDEVRVTGWLSPPHAPTNPGQFDQRVLLDQQGIAGYLTLRQRDDWELIAPAGWLARLGWTPEVLSDAASDALRLGMRADPIRLELLDALLLGRRGNDPDVLGDSFRRVGLAYLLAISGAHLAVLLGLVWLAARLACPFPSWAALGVLVVLGLYLLIVPAHVPILRSGFMAAMLCLAYGAGRRVATVNVLAISAFLLLIWRPNDLFDAGFQLSFVVVAAALLFVPAAARWIWTRPMAATGPYRLRDLAARWFADYLAFNLVAALFAFPLVAYHFGVINPLGLGLSIISFPAVGLVMGLGFVKILAGMAFPSGGLLLARPLEWATGLMTLPVGTAAAWPKVQVTLSQPPSALWTVVTLGVLAGVFSGWFRDRRRALILTAGVCGLWLAIPDLGLGAAGNAIKPSVAAPLRLTALSVGDGSCFLLRLADGSERYTIMFDCGSREDTSIGQHAVVPALRSLGVDRIDTLMISHAGMDYFCGSLDLMDQIPVGRVLTTYYVLDDAHDKPHGAAGLLIRGVRERGIPIETVVRGWRQRCAGAELEMLWPPPDLDKPHAHDTCLVLAARAAGRRLLLNGDLGRAAVEGMLGARTDLRADVTDLPSLADFMSISPRWLAAVHPSIVLQSTGPHGLSPDKWAAAIDSARVTRLVTGRQGMVNVEIDARGALTWSAYRTSDRMGG